MINPLRLSGTLLKELQHPHRLRHRLVRLGEKVNRRVAAVRYPSDDGIDVFDKKWDNLIIIDACRYDLFEEHHEFSGTLSKVRSAGSHSREFISRNFIGTTHHDTVYVTANPHAAWLDGDTFHAVINLFDGEWDENVQTVRPESVVAATIQAHEAYPEKRIISHFMQPHYPFLGELGSQFESGGVNGQVVGNTENTATEPPIWHLLDIGRSPVDSQTARDAYIENFVFVQEYVQELLDELDGKSVITSDHGNLLGERLWPLPIRKYGHPKGIRKPGLVEVPWHEVPFDQRRTTTTDTPEEMTAVSDSVVEQRLENLGYV